MAGPGVKSGRHEARVLLRTRHRRVARYVSGCKRRQGTSQLTRQWQGADADGNAASVRRSGVSTLALLRTGGDVRDDPCDARGVPSMAGWAVELLGVQGSRDGCERGSGPMKQDDPVQAVLVGDRITRSPPAARWSS